MAQLIETKLIDDLDGKAAAETLVFALDGKNYEIDLSKKNATSLRKVFEPYIEKARKVRGGTARKTSSASRSRRASANGKTDAAVVREWALANGHEVPTRGRIPNDIREAYDAAH